MVNIWSTEIHMWSLKFSLCKFHSFTLICFGWFRCTKNLWSGKNMLVLAWGKIVFNTLCLLWKPPLSAICFLCLCCKTFDGHVSCRCVNGTALADNTHSIDIDLGVIFSVEFMIYVMILLMDTALSKEGVSWLRWVVFDEEKGCQGQCRLLHLTISWLVMMKGLSWL